MWMLGGGKMFLAKVREVANYKKLFHMGKASVDGKAVGCIDLSPQHHQPNSRSPAPATRDYTHPSSHNTDT
jgi:hypothetical protein